MDLSEWMAGGEGRPKLNDAELAERLDVRPSTVSRIRRGLVMPDTTVLRAILRETDGAVTPNDLLARYDAERANPLPPPAPSHPTQASA